MVNAGPVAYTGGIEWEYDVFAVSAPLAWLDRVRALRCGQARDAERGIGSLDVPHLSLAGESDAFTRSSGVVPGVRQGPASVSLGEVIDAPEAFERAVRRLVPAGSQQRLIRQRAVDFASHRVVVLGVRVPSLSWVRLAALREFDDRIEAVASVDERAARGGSSAVGLIWFALPRGAKPVTVRPLARFA